MTTTTNTGSSFRFGGLATGLDTNSIIDTLATAERAPATKLESQSSAIDVRVSALGQLSTRLLSLKTAADDVVSGGFRGVKVASPTSSFSATTASHAQPGAFSVNVTQLAQAAQARSQSFASPSTAGSAAGGTLTIGVDGTNIDVDIGAGLSLSAIADAINASGAGVNAAVLDTGNGAYLSVKRNDSGFTIGGDANAALTFSGGVATDLGLAITQSAKNAKVEIDGLAFERTSNTIADAIAGTTLTLTQLSAAPEQLVLASDSDATYNNVIKLVQAYNDVMSLTQKHLDIQASTDRDTTLAGESLVRGIQQSLQAVVSKDNGSGTAVRALADIGIRSNRDGSLSLDADALKAALARDGRGVDTILNGANGIGATIDAIVDQASGRGGSISTRTDALSQRKRQLTDQVAQIDRRVEAYKTLLINQFSAMEQRVSALNAQSSALSSLSALLGTSSSNK